MLESHSNGSFSYFLLDLILLMGTKISIELFLLLVSAHEKGFDLTHIFGSIKKSHLRFCKIKA